MDYHVKLDTSMMPVPCGKFALLKFVISRIVNKQVNLKDWLTLFANSWVE